MRINIPVVCLWCMRHKPSPTVFLSQMALVKMILLMTIFQLGSGFEVPPEWKAYLHKVVEDFIRSIQVVS